MSLTKRKIDLGECSLNREGWYILQGDNSVGPFTKNLILDMIYSGTIPDEIPIRFNNRSAWQKVGEVFFDEVLTEPQVTESETRNANVWTDNSPRPLRRLLARSLDTVIYSAAFIAAYISAVSILPEAKLTIDKYVDFISGSFRGFLFDTIYVTLINATLIGLMGTTPGKWLFGVKVLDQYKNKLGIMRALSRETRVLARGLCFNIPALTLVTMYVARGTLNTFGYTSWDLEGKCSIVQRSGGQRQNFYASIGVVLLLSGIAAYAKSKSP